MIIFPNINNNSNHLPLVLTKSGFANALGTNVNIGFQNAQKALKEKINLQNVGNDLLWVLELWMGHFFFFNVFVL